MMRPPTAGLTSEGLAALMRDVADGLSCHPEVCSTLALNHVIATAADVSDALLAADVCLDPAGGITIRPNGSGQRILVSIAKFVADEIDAALGERVMFTMLT
jgi:hypothetical protein